MIDEREAYLVRIGGCIADMEKANNHLRNVLADLENEQEREGSLDGKEPVCWNCDNAVRIEIAGGLRPAFRPCHIWVKDGICQYKPYEGT